MPQFTKKESHWCCNFYHCFTSRMCFRKLFLELYRSFISSLLCLPNSLLSFQALKKI